MNFFKNYMMASRFYRRRQFMKLKQIICMKIVIKISMFDFNDYPQDSKFFYLANETVIGKMKDEFKGKIIIEFAGSKSKMYSLM